MSPASPAEPNLTDPTADANTADANIDAVERRPRVRVVLSVAEPVTNALILQGRTAADRHVDLRAETHGVIEEVLAERGAWIEAGAPLVRLSVDEREARVAEAQALLAQRRIEYSVAEELNRRGHRADTELAAARASLDAALAALRLAEVRMENLVIAAPFAGVVADRMVELGDFVDIGDPIARVIDLDPLRIVAQMSERHLGLVVEGATGSARMIDGQIVDGTVTFVAAETNPATRTFAVELEIPNEDGRFIEGVTAELTLPYADTRAHRLIPSALTLSDEGLVGIKAVNADNRIDFHPVEIVDGNRDAIWVQGLPERLRIVVVGQDYVRAGDRVEPFVTAQVAEGEDRQ